MSRRSLQRPMLAKLEYGIVENRPSTVKHFIEEGVDVNALAPTNGVRPLELALEMRNVSIMRLLLDAGADTEGTNAQGSTILIEACRYGYLECAKLLTRNGANLYTLDVNGKTCLHAALEGKHYSIVTYLLNEDACEGEVCPATGLCLWQYLILTDDDVSMSKLRHNEFDLDHPCPDGTVLVFLAIKHFKNKALKGLLKLGADPNIQNADGHFALCEAVEENNIDAVKLLIQHGADVHLKDKGIWSPIRLAIFNSSEPVVELLLDSGVDIEQDLGFVGTPLTLCCSMGYIEGAQLLIERGANLNARAVDGRTCLLLGLEYKNHSIVNYLLDQDVCEVNGTGRTGLSALHYAILLNNVDMTRKLIQKQADVNVKNHEGEVPVFFAAKHGKLDLLRMLLEADADPNIPIDDGDFALHEAVKRRDVEVVKLLLHHGADKDKLDENEMTPVEVAEILFPPPQDIIHCLRNGYMVDQDHEVSHPSGSLAKDNKKIFDAEVEEALCCPITFEIMKDPVIASDGHTYERKAIEEWIREKKESPVTRLPLTSATLIPNLTVKHLIDGFAKMNRNP